MPVSSPGFLATLRGLPWMTKRELWPPIQYRFVSLRLEKYLSWAYLSLTLRPTPLSPTHPVCHVFYSQRLKRQKNPAISTMAEHIPIRLQFQAQAYTRKKYETFHVDKSAGAIYSRPDSQSWEIWENVSRMYARVRIYREYPSRSYRSTIWYERLDDNKEFNLFDLLSPERDDTGTLYDSSLPHSESPHLTNDLQNVQVERWR